MNHDLKAIVLIQMYERICLFNLDRKLLKPSQIREYALYDLNRGLLF